ncbi:MAG: hypothetical protein K2P86_08140 [Xanthobacteraceae bacterium]|nr:hypothetical protein [Xanthobacteraceae bacterium]
MKIFNRHEIEIAASQTELGKLIDTLASANDLMWPHFRWPRMRFDRPLSAGARGGHGPIGYWIEEYEPGSRILFRFENTHWLSRGIEGYHTLFMEQTASGTKLVHEIVGTIRGRALLLWPLAVRPLHDALIEDGLARAAKHFNALHPFPPELSLWARSLRLLAGSRDRRVGVSQSAPLTRLK